MPLLILSIKLWLLSPYCIQILTWNYGEKTHWIMHYKKGVTCVFNGHDIYIYSVVITLQSNPRF